MSPCVIACQIIFNVIFANENSPRNMLRRLSFFGLARRIAYAALLSFRRHFHRTASLNGCTIDFSSSVRVATLRQSSFVLRDFHSLCFVDDDVIANVLAQACWPRCRRVERIGNDDHEECPVDGKR